jgi:hypothetical protein
MYDHDCDKKLTNHYFCSVCLFIDEDCHKTDGRKLRFAKSAKKTKLVTF